MKVKLLNVFVIAALLLIVPKSTFSQADLPDATSDVPIDGGLSLLAAAGVAYGAKKISEKRKRKLEKRLSHDGEK